MGFLFGSKSKKKLKATDEPTEKAAERTNDAPDEEAVAEIDDERVAEPLEVSPEIAPEAELDEAAPDDVQQPKDVNLGGDGVELEDWHPPLDSESGPTDGKDDEIVMSFESVMAPDKGKKKNPRDTKLFKSLLSSLYDAVLIVDLKGTVIESNPRAEKFFEYTQAELWNTHCSELIEAISTRVLNKIQQHAESGRFTVINVNCRRKNGSTFPAEIAVSKIHMLHEGDLIFSIRNLEKREKGKGEYEMELEGFRFAGAGLVLCNLDGLIECVNPAFIRLLQYDREDEVENSNLRDFCQQPEVVDEFLKPGSKEGAWIGRLKMRSGKGWDREFIATAVQSSYKEGLHFILTMTPVPKQIIAS
jgi:PAS domain S-box-containing protein